MARRRRDDYSDNSIAEHRPKVRLAHVADEYNGAIHTPASIVASTGGVGFNTIADELRRGLLRGRVAVVGGLTVFPRGR